MKKLFLEQVGGLFLAIIAFCVLAECLGHKVNPMTAVSMLVTGALSVYLFLITAGKMVMYEAIIGLNPILAVMVIPAPLVMRIAHRNIEGMYYLDEKEVRKSVTRRISFMLVTCVALAILLWLVTSNLKSENVSTVCLESLEYVFANIALMSAQMLYRRMSESPESSHDE